MSTHAPFNLRDRYLWIDSDGEVTPSDVTPTWWADLISGADDLGGGRWLLGAGTSNESPANWDLHPDGECILMLLSGSIDMVWATGAEEHTAELRATGDTVVVPRGAWHRQIVNGPSSRIFLVAGAGTTMRPVAHDRE